MFDCGKVQQTKAFLLRLLAQKNIEYIVFWEVCLYSFNQTLEKSRKESKTIEKIIHTLVYPTSNQLPRQINIRHNFAFLGSSLEIERELSFFSFMI
jgi:hypothetical protein